MSSPSRDAISPHRRVLLIETDPAYRAAMAACLRLADCRVAGVPDPIAAGRVLDSSTFELLVWGVPPSLEDPRGEVLAELRRHSQAPLVMVDGGLDRAQFDLEAGADQWLPKPFVPGALIEAARSALLRRPSSIPDPHARVDVYGMTFDGAARELRFAGQSASFSLAGWTLLRILLGERNRFVSDEEVLRLVIAAGDDEPGEVLGAAPRIQRELTTMTLPCQLLSRPGWGHCLDFTGVGPAHPGSGGPPPTAGPPPSQPRSDSSRAGSPK